MTVLFKKVFIWGKNQLPFDKVLTSRFPYIILNFKIIFYYFINFN